MSREHTMSCISYTSKFENKFQLISITFEFILPKIIMNAFAPNY